MLSKGDSSVGQIFVTFVFIGILVAYWFYTASLFGHGAIINLSQSSFLPVYCSIASDRASDTKQSAQVYFWLGTVRVDLQVQTLGKPTIYAHQIINQDSTSYLWRDDKPIGNKLKNVTDSQLISGLAGSTNSWFCFPWILFDYSKFNPPSGESFQ